MSLLLHLLQVVGEEELDEVAGGDDKVGFEHVAGFEGDAGLGEVVDLVGDH